MRVAYNNPQKFADFSASRETLENIIHNLITSARWGLQGAEAVLKLRSINSSGDLDGYWAFHRQQSNVRLYDGLSENKIAQ